MPKVGVPELITFLITGTAYLPVSAGSPGPFDRNKPSGFSARISSADVGAGHTGVRAPSPGRQPQNIALDAVVDGNDVELGRGLPAKPLFPGPGRFVPGEALA